MPYRRYLNMNPMGAQVNQLLEQAQRQSNQQGGNLTPEQIQERMAQQLFGQFQQMLGQGQNPLVQQAGQMAQSAGPQQNITQNLMGQFGRLSGQFNPNQMLEQAQRQVTRGQQQPELWGRAQQTVQDQLAPGYSAYGQQEDDARFQRMQERIGQEFDRQRQSTQEDMSRRGLYRTGLHDQQMGELGKQQAEATQRAATDVYLSGQEATRQQQSQALQTALGLGGQQAGLQQQNLSNLMGMGQYMQGQQQQAQMLPFQIGQQLHGMAGDDYQSQFRNMLAAAGLQQQADMAPFQAGMGLYGAMNAPADRQAQQQVGQQQAQGSFWGNLLSIVPMLFGMG